MKHAADDYAAIARAVGEQQKAELINRLLIHASQALEPFYGKNVTEQAVAQLKDIAAWYIREQTPLADLPRLIEGEGFLISGSLRRAARM